MKKHQATDSLPTVSFIIPTLNAGRFLDGCLSAIRSQDYPQDKVEIVIADAHSTDTTAAIAKKYGATIIPNPEILHEPGKTLASQVATGELLFYTDADNWLAKPNWLKLMTAPYLKEKGVVGLLPQTIPAPDSSGMNRYLGYLFTDPLTWFTYGKAGNPCDYHRFFKPLSQTSHYQIYRFDPHNPPLFGLSQGVGVARSFQRGGVGAADDMLSGIQLLEQGGLIAYIPEAGVYHYHVDSLANFINKYRWRIRNNLTQQVKGMGMVHRLKYYNWQRKVRLGLFIPYSLSLILPFLDSIRLVWRWRDSVMFYHLPACVTLALVILAEYGRKLFRLSGAVGTYGEK